MFGQNAGLETDLLISAAIPDERTFIVSDKRSQWRNFDFHRTDAGLHLTLRHAAMTNNPLMSVWKF